MGPIISSTIPDPWGGIGGVGVPPSRGSPLVFGQGQGSGSPPGAARPPPPAAAADPWGAPAASAAANIDPWGAPQQSDVSPAKRE